MSSRIFYEPRSIVDNDEKAQLFRFLIGAEYIFRNESDVTAYHVNLSHFFCHKRPIIYDR